MVGLWGNCFHRGGKKELGVGLHASAPIMMVDISRLINVSKISPATLVSPSLFPLELHKSCSSEGEIPGMVTQKHFPDGVIVGERE